MYIIAIAWGFVVMLMAATEATSTQGTLLGAFFTLVLYGVLPLTIVLYIMGTPIRKRARLAAEARQPQPTQPLQADSADPDGGRVPASDPVAPVRKEP